MELNYKRLTNNKNNTTEKAVETLQKPQQRRGA